MTANPFELDTDLSKVCINAEFYEQACDLYDLLMVDSTTSSDRQIHRLASMFQDAFDKGEARGWDDCKKKVISNLFEKCPY